MSAGRIKARRISVRAVFAYGAAFAMTPYLVIKISWVVGALTGVLPRADHSNVAGVVALNTVTIGMAAAGVALAAALIRPWGERIPAIAVLSCAWIGGGFLVPMIPYAVLDTLITVGNDVPGREAPVLPGWEYSLIQVSFIGMGIGLAGALPFYLKARWPTAFQGKVEDVRPFRARRSGVALAGTVVAGALSLYWAVGGTTGLQHPAARELTWHLQAANTAVWSLAGAWSIWLLARARSTVPLWIPITLSWLVSGFLVAWGGWKLPFAVLQLAGVEVGAVWPEHPGVAAAQFVLNIVAGVATLSTVLGVYRARRRSPSETQPFR